MKLQHLLRRARHFKRRSTRMSQISMGMGRRRYRKRRGGTIMPRTKYIAPVSQQRKTNRYFTRSNAVKALKVAGTLGALALGAKYGVPASVVSALRGPNMDDYRIGTRIDPKKLY